MIVKKIVKTIGSKLVGGSLPDIDTDFDSRRRGEVKNYMEERFGRNQVSSVGTFTTLKIKSIIKDLDRQFDNNIFVANTVTSIIDDNDATLLDLYKRAVKEPKLKEYIQRNSDIFHIMPSIINQPKALSIHPCAVIIVPSVMKSEEWFPVRLQNGLMVAEWSGGDMDDAGFLKQDILGVKQLAKFSDILRLVKKNKGISVDIYNLPESNEVYRYFSNGWTNDIFQMGTEPLSAYTKYLKPEGMEDLIATIALYRPGPMENNYHNIYVQRKNEGSKVTYLFGSENITKNTSGLIVYQEQVMQMCMKVGGLTMLEADDVRRAMGKKDIKYLESYAGKVKEGYLNNGASELEFNTSWSAMLEFAKYSFNRSHSAAYAITGYIGQYLKVRFPIEFWTVALSFSDDKKVPRFLSEIFETKEVSVASADVNKSMSGMVSDLETNTIYWGIESIKGIGDAASSQIIGKRPKVGYKNFEDFFDINNFKGSKVNKTHTEALISSGAFDRLHNLEGKEYKRNDLINRFRELKKVKIANIKKDLFINGTTQENWWWLLQQKKFTGIAFVDFEKLCEDNGIKTPYLTAIENSKRQDRGVFRSLGGYVTDIKVKKNAKGEFAFINIESNYKMYKLTIWSNEYENLKPFIDKCSNSFILFDAELKFEPKFNKKNVFVAKKNTKIVVLN